MTDHDDEFVYELFQRIVGLPSDQQEFALAQEAGHIPGLIDKVRRLLEVERAVPVIPDHDAEAATSPVLPAKEFEGSRFRPTGFHKSGGGGEVWRARDEEFGREVALKRIRQDFAHEVDHATFLREAQVTGQLEHPGIAPVYSLGRDRNGGPYYVMRFVPGKDMWEEIKEFYKRKVRGPALNRHDQDFRGLLQALIAACKVIAFAHSRGVIHQDIKPSNIMLGEYGETLVIDWGSAKQMTQEVLQNGPARACQGTPGFMSPEQKAGGLREVGPATDIYALGATLYALLTGQVPKDRTERSFKRPRKINARVPRQLEAVCLKAMAVQPEERYAKVEELAGDMDRWLADVPVTARSEPWRDRFQRWVRRHPTAAFASLLLLCLAGAVCLWITSEKAKLEYDVKGALDQAEERIQQENWTEAKAAVERADGRLSGWSPNRFHQLVEQMRADVEMAVRLEDIRRRASEFKDGRWNTERLCSDIKAAFIEYGLDLEKLDDTEFAARVRESRIKARLLCRLDDWRVVAHGLNADECDRLSNILRLADPHPWRSGFRDSLFKKEDRRDLEALANSVPVSEVAPDTLVLLATAVSPCDGGGSELAQKVLRQAHSQYPGDLWINLALAEHLSSGRTPAWEDVVHFSGIAVSLNPKSALAWLKLSCARRNQGKLEEALDSALRAAELSPDLPRAHAELGLVFLARKDAGEALTFLRKAIDVFTTPDRVSWLKAPATDRIDQFRKEAARSDFAQLEMFLGIALEMQGNIDGAVAAFEKSISLHPGQAKAHMHLGRCLHARENWETAVAALRKAIVHAPGDAEAHFFLGLTLLHQAKLPEALVALKRGHQLGSKTPGWSHPSGSWVRQADQLIALDSILPAVLNGELPLDDPDERLLIAKLCQFKRLFAASARYYAEALEARPMLAHDMANGYRYSAARVASLASGGQGKDTAKLDSEGRAKLRRNAIAWLREDLAFFSAKLQKGDEQECSAVRRTLLNWKTDPALAGIRDDAKVDDLPEVERKACRELWSDVEALLGTRQPRWSHIVKQG